MRIGILGGTFDPPHSGHVNMARCAQEALGLDRILFVPCSRQPLKRSSPSASGFHRAAMVALAIARHKNWLLETIELDRGGVSYMVETLSALRSGSAKGVRFSLIIGQDSFASFPRWRRFEEILALADLAVIPREPPIPESLPRDLPETCITRIPAQPVKVSSTDIRLRFAEGRSVSGLVPRAVESYIFKQDLYGARVRRGPFGGDRDG